ncbi:MAG: hypothetical protein MI867_11495 [Pseudomonadales bacterium]|nr:hypothetical protein [Pseudomonadales bacterium]
MRTEEAEGGNQDTIQEEAVAQPAAITPQPYGDCSSFVGGELSTRSSWQQVPLYATIHKHGVLATDL